MPQEFPKNKYKYHEEHTKLPCECPVENSLSDHDGVVFRFVHEVTTHRNCSIPNIKINPARKSNNCRKNCGGYALSFYVSLEQAKSNHLYFSENFKNFKQTVGSHIAECRLSPADGKREEISAEGHFNFHEYEGTDFTNRFENSLAAQP